MVSYEFKGKHYPINITYKDQLGFLRDDFGINLLKLFVDNEAAQQTMAGLLLDDEVTINLCWKYIEPTTSLTFDEFIEALTPRDVDRFRDDFWTAVVNFTSPLKRGIMQQTWDDMKRELKQSQKQTSTSVSSVSDQEE